MVPPSFFQPPLPPNNHNTQNNQSPVTNGNPSQIQRQDQQLDHDVSNISTASLFTSSHADGEVEGEIDPDADPDLRDPDKTDSAFQTYLPGLREISSLATWRLSSSKPGCALAQLRHPSPNYFWQSDGPQPHTLNLHFFKLVAITKMRIYLDFELDESYTPTKIKYAAGFREGDLVEFASWEVPEPIIGEDGNLQGGGIEGVHGWVDVDLTGVGGREADPKSQDEGYGSDGLGFDRRKSAKQKVRKPFIPQPGQTESDEELYPLEEYEEAEQNLMEEYLPGDVLKCMILQVRICENHQNGKDTHVRGFQVFAKDEQSMKEGRQVVKKAKRGQTPADGIGEEEAEVEIIGLQRPYWMDDPEIR